MVLAKVEGKHEYCVLVDSNEEYAVECHLMEDDESPTGESWVSTLYKSHPSGTWYEVDGACFWGFGDAVEAAEESFAEFTPYWAYVEDDYFKALEVLEA